MSRDKPLSRIVATPRAIWASFWIFALPKEFLGLVGIWPTFFLASASYLWEPSDGGVRLILLAAIWDLVIGFRLTLSAMERSQGALMAMVSRLQECTYTPIEWTGVLRQGDEAVIDRSSLIE